MISLLIVNYRSAQLAIEAIRSARAATAGALQVVVVDNSVDPSEEATLRPHCDALVVSTANVGYAAAVNAGRKRCEGATIVVSNPDVVFRERSIDLLSESLSDSVAAAGPALYWDDGESWILPPSDPQTLSSRLDEALASRSRSWFRWRDRRRIRHRLRFWQLAQPTPVSVISGAVMAISASDFDAVEGFDERFRLYFEETDFLRRIAKRGKRILYVPEARCRHLYNQSAGQSPEAPSLYAQSERAYLEKWYGRGAARILARLTRDVRLPDPGAAPIAVDGREYVVEASPLRTFATAAGHFPERGSVTVPEEVWRSFRGETLYLRAVRRADAHVAATWALHK